MPPVRSSEHRPSVVRTWTRCIVAGVPAVYGFCGRSRTAEFGAHGVEFGPASAELGPQFTDLRSQFVAAFAGRGFRSAGRSRRNPGLLEVIPKLGIAVAFGTEFGFEASNGRGLSLECGACSGEVVAGSG